MKRSREQLYQNPNEIDRMKNCAQQKSQNQIYTDKSQVWCRSTTLNRSTSCSIITNLERYYYGLCVGYCATKHIPISLKTLKRENEEMLCASVFCACKKTLCFLYCSTRVFLLHQNLNLNNKRIGLRLDTMRVKTLRFE